MLGLNLKNCALFKHTLKYIDFIVFLLALCTVGKRRYLLYLLVVIKFWLNNKFNFQFISQEGENKLKIIRQNPEILSNYFQFVVACQMETVTKAYCSWLLPNGNSPRRKVLENYFLTYSHSRVVFDRYFSRLKHELTAVSFKSRVPKRKYQIGIRN